MKKTPEIAKGADVWDANEILVPSRRQQDKIVAVMQTGDIKQFGKPQAAVLPEERDDFLWRVANGEISTDQLRDVIRNNIHRGRECESAAQICERLNGRQRPDEPEDDYTLRARMRGLLNEGLRGWEYMTRDLREADVARCLDRPPRRGLLGRKKNMPDWSDPWVFYEWAREDIRQLAASQGTDAARPYVHADQELMKLLYGKKYEYLQQVELLQREAKERFPVTDQRPDRIDEVKTEKDPDKLKSYMVREIKSIFQYLEERGFKVRPNHLHERQYQRLRAANPLFYLIPRRWLQLTGKYDSNWLSNLESEILPEHLKRIPTDVLSTERQAEEKRRKFENFQLEKLAPQEASSILSRTEILGGEYAGRKLTTQDLEQAQLMPEYKVTIGDGVVVYFSSNYELDPLREAVVAYVESAGQIVARSYYRSASSGDWRWLPGYHKDLWYSKGLGLGEISLPLVTKRALAMISQKEPRQVAQADFLFCGTAHSLSKKEVEYLQEYYQASSDTARKRTTAMLEDLRPTAAQSEPARLPRKLAGNFYRGEQGSHFSPAEVDFDNYPENPEAPDFSKLITSWTDQRPQFGRFLVEVYPSRDGKLYYAICQDSTGRFWFWEPEAEGEILPSGMKKEWVQGGSLTSPAIRHKSDAGGQGTPIPGDQEYVDMYPNYLSKLPPIIRYREHIELRDQD